MTPSSKKTFSFSDISIAKLKTCHVDLQCLFFKVIKYFDCTISEGHRGEEAQNKAFSQGKSEKKWPHGNHNKIPSMAVDVYPFPVNLHPSSKREAEIYKYRMAYFAGQVMAIARHLKEQGVISHDVIWGCDWDGDTELADHSFLDFPHFELVSP